MNRPDLLVEAYVLLATPLGPMALGARGGRLRGSLLPRLGSAPHLEAMIAKAWPSAEPDSSVLSDLARQVRAYWRGQVRPFQVELDLEGFPRFFACVWLAAMRIPPGSVQTYGQLAASVGAPKAARAVGGAMANNPFPLVVACHRVVPAGGGLGGFSAPGGPCLKQSLLDWERKYCPSAAQVTWRGRGLFAAVAPHMPG